MLFRDKAILLFLTLGLCCSLAKAETLVTKAPVKITKSSEIPAKRDYPVDNSVNPCVNFYEYACSPVIASFQLREDRSHHTFAFSDADERLLEFKKKYFAGLTHKKPESSLEEETKTYYLACMNQKARAEEEKAYVEGTKKMLSKIKTRKQFIDLVASNITNASQLSFIGFNASEPNLDRPAYNDLFFDTDLRSLPERSYYKNQELVKDLKAIMKDFFVTIGEENPEQRANLVFNFEKSLAMHYPTPPIVRERFSMRTKISRDELINKYPNLRLKEFFIRIPKHVVIRNIIGRDTMRFLDRKLQTAALEELKSIYLYFQLRPIMDDAYPEFFAKKFAFCNKYLGGPNKRPERQERCTLVVMESFDKEVDYTLLPKFFPNFPKEKFVRSIEKIRQALVAQLEKNTWLSKSAKKEAVRKISTAKLALVSPDTEADWDFNPRATYSLTAPIANQHKLSQLLMEKSLNELKGPVNTNRWQMGPLTVNAYYNPSYNKVVFPVGILQYPFFDSSEPEEVNFAAIGAVIGHELGHAIDDQGNKFNADGAFKDWLKDTDRKNFRVRSQGLIRQFDKIGHNGKFTLGENIGDLVGLTTAYRAAFSSAKPYNQDLQRRFFLQYARLWCEIEREGLTKMRVKVDPHSLGCARVNEQIKQQPAFGRAYNCKPSDPMVIPESKQVKIWQ